MDIAHRNVPIVDKAVPSKKKNKKERRKKTAVPIPEIVVNAKGKKKGKVRPTVVSVDTKQRKMTKAEGKAAREAAFKQWQAETKIGQGAVCL